MDVIRIPDIDRLISMSLQTIDTFSTWSEDLEVRFNSKSVEFPISKMTDTLKTLAKYKFDTVIPKVNTLFYLLTETILNVVGSQKTLPTSSKKSLGQIIRNKVQKLTSTSGSVLPIPSFDEKTTNQLHRDAKQLNKLIENHQEIYRGLQKQQEVCWITKSKVSKYELCLSTARHSRDYMNDKLPASDLKSRDKAIEQLQRILECKLKKAADATHQYQCLLDRERSARLNMKEIESKLIDSVMFGITERVITGLASLKNILASKPNERSTILISHIQRMISDSRCFVSSFIDGLSADYRYCSPQEYHEQNKFSTRLPDCKVIKLKHKKQTTENLNEESQTQSTNNNSEDPDSEEYTFISNKKIQPEELDRNQILLSHMFSRGSTVKQKIATESTPLVFGWCKSYPWSRKRWGFYTKVISP